MSGVVTSLGDLLSTIRQLIQGYSGSMSSNSQRALLTVTAGSGALLLWKLSRPKLPPGPSTLPIIGNIHQLGSDRKFHVLMDKFKREYGELVTIYIGPNPIVVLNSAEMVREAFIRQTDITSNRMYNLTFDLFTEGGMDMFGANYSPRVQIQRKLAHQALRKFSNGGKLETYTSKAFAAMCEELDKNPNLDGQDTGFLVAYNILLSMSFGKTFSFEDPFFREMIRQTKEMEELFEAFNLSDIFPIFRYLPLSAANRRAVEFTQSFFAYFEKMWDEHTSTYEPGKLTDFTYQLISVMKESEEDENDRKNMKLLNKRHYLHLLSDLFFAGTDTTRMTLNWIWHYLAAYPEIQKKAQEEVDALLGRDGDVTAQCREQLPYVDAFLHEVMRIRPVAPVGMFHETSAPMELGGYHLPSGTGLLSNTWSIHMDEKQWPEPEAFLPERWLDENGQYQFQQQGFVPFSMGRRSCVGEAFVKIELHMLTTMFLQKYTIAPTDGYTVSLDMFDGPVMKPVAQKPLVVKRR